MTEKTVNKHHKLPTAGRLPGRRSKSAAMTTLKDVAKVAGVSAQTVSCVVNNTGSVSEEVRERIRQIADEMGYLPNKSAKAMRTGLSQTLGLVITDMSNPFYPALAQAVERAAAAADYAVLLVDANGSPSAVAERIGALKGHPVDGVIATEYSPALDRLNVPTVLIGGPVNGLDCVNADDAAGGAMLAEHLLQRRHRALGMVTGPLKGCVPVRRDGFLARVRAEAKIVWEAFTSPDESLTDEIESMLSRRDMTVVVCSNDLIAIGVLRALRRLAIRVPEDLSVVGFDDIPWAAIVTPALTTVRQPYSGLGAVAVDLLMKRIANPNRRYRRLKLDMSLVERESVLSPPAPPKTRATFSSRAAVDTAASHNTSDRTGRAAQRDRPLETEKS